MAATPAPKIRRSLVDLQKDYDSGNKAPLEALMRAWKGIKELPPDDPRSFFMIGGYHGEPFRGKGEFDPNWWGGYCQHGTVLFPSWHRAYLWRLEQALQSIPGCADVTLPFVAEIFRDKDQLSPRWIMGQVVGPGSSSNYDRSRRSRQPSFVASLVRNTVASGCA